MYSYSHVLQWLKSHKSIMLFGCICMVIYMFLKMCLLFSCFHLI
jgi:hypothetical protein